jgi:hypothetical protein
MAITLRKLEAQQQSDGRGRAGCDDVLLYAASTALTFG